MNTSHQPFPQPAPIQQTIVVQAAPQSQALPALCNVCMPGLGQLIQGRILAALIWFVVANVSALLCAVFVGFVLFPLVWLGSIIDAARYQPRPGQGFSVARVAVGVALALAVLFFVVPVAIGLFAPKVVAPGAPAVGNKPVAPATVQTVVGGAEEKPVGSAAPVEEPAVEQSAPVAGAAMGAAPSVVAPAPPVASEKSARPQRGLRTWRDQSGQFSVSARLVGVMMGRVTLAKEDGAEIVVPMERLSGPDRDYVAKQMR